MPLENLSIFEEDFWTLRRLLKKLLESSQAQRILLIDRSGRLIASAGDTLELDTTSFASLSAADFSATNALAALLGEEEFTSIFHQGERQNIYIALVEPRVMVAVIFDNRTTYGLVRIRVKQTVEELAQVFKSIFKKLNLEEEKRTPFGKDFTTEAEAKLDNLFG